MSDFINEKEVDKVIKNYINNILDDFTGVFRNLVFNAFKDDFEAYWNELKENADDSIRIRKPTFFYVDIYEHQVPSDGPKISKINNNDLFLRSQSWDIKRRKGMFDFQELTKQLLYGKNKVRIPDSNDNEDVPVLRKQFADFYNIERYGKNSEFLSLLIYFSTIRNDKTHIGETDHKGVYTKESLQELTIKCLSFLGMCKKKAQEDSELKKLIDNFSDKCASVNDKARKRIKVSEFIRNHNFEYELDEINACIIVNSLKTDDNTEWIYEITDAELVKLVENLRTTRTNQSLSKYNEERLRQDKADAYREGLKKGYDAGLKKQTSEPTYNTLPYTAENVSVSVHPSGRKKLIIIIIVFVLFCLFVVRPIANHNKAKKYEKASISASVSAEEAKLNSDLVEFSDIAHDDSVVIENREDTDNNGNKYENNVYASSPYSMITYNLAGKFDTFKGTWYVSEQGKNTELDNYFEVLVDNEVVYTSPKITKGSQPVEFDVDLNFGKAMTILFVSDDSCGIGEATLSCSDKSKVKELSGDVTVPLWLTSTEPLKIDDAVYVTDYSDISNVASIPLNHYITADTTEWDDDGNEVEKPRKVEYLLDGKYKKLSGVFAITQNGKSSERKQQFEVYADSTLVYTSKEITSSDMPEAFEVDVENCKNLSIVITKGDGSAAVSALRAY